MAGIDDDLMDGGTVSPKKDEQQVDPRKERMVDSFASQKHGQVIDVIFRITHYLIDAVMITLSIYMMNMKEAYPLVFCVGLIIWMAYRILYFQRNKTIDIIIGFFLFVVASFFCISAIIAHENGWGKPEVVGRMLIPTIYLGFFCVWGAIRRKRNGEE